MNLPNSPTLARGTTRNPTQSATDGLENSEDASSKKITIPSSICQRLSKDLAIRRDAKGLKHILGPRPESWEPRRYVQRLTTPGVRI